jgi:uncharacterized protein (TIGR03435 family)
MKSRPRQLAVLCLALGMGASASGQDRAAFEVVSIKPNRSGTAGLTLQRPSPSTLVATNIPLAAFIRSTFRIRPPQLIGAPSWTETERYDIETRAGGNPTFEQFQQMMESLLADRFGMVARRETRQLPIYGLVVDDPRRGHKLKPTTVETCPPQSPESLADPAAPPPCGLIRVTATGMAGRRVALPLLAEMLAQFADRAAILDRSGADGLFDIDLAFETMNPSGTSIYTAVREQLGLRLDPQTGPVPVVVIEKIERPTEN